MRVFYVRALLSSSLLYSSLSVAVEHKLSKIHDPLSMHTAVFLKVPRKDFFTDITGLSEVLWLRTDRAACFVTDQHEPKNFKIKNSKTKQEFSMGHFEELTLEQVQQAAEKLPAVNTGTFNVRAGYATASDSWFRACLDVGALQADPAHKDAVFQVASNFSALEPVSTNNYPEQGLVNS